MARRRRKGRKNRSPFSGTKVRWNRSRNNGLKFRAGKVGYRL